MAELLLAIVGDLQERLRINPHGFLEYFCDCLLDLWIRVIKMDKDVLYTVVVETIGPFNWK